MDINDVENLAELAKLDLTEEEKEGLLHDMEGILDYVKQIQDIDLPAQAGVLEINQVHDRRNSWREDELRMADDFSHGIIVEQFPDSQDGFVKVKKIL